MPPKLKRTTKNEHLEDRGVVEDAKKLGFPDFARNAIQTTADNKSVITISRVPGLATTSLIEEGYALKGFHIKAKSCDWGPMAGFLCKQPLFNKAGLDKLVYNLNQLVNYQKEMRKVLPSKKDLAPPADIKKRRKDIFEKEENNDLVSFDKFTPFLPLKISNSRKDLLLDKESDLGKKLDLLNLYQEDNAIILGAYNPQPIGEQNFAQGTIAVIFALKPSDNKETWSIYHGDIKVFWGGKWLDYPSDNFFTDTKIEIPKYTIEDRQTGNKKEDEGLEGFKKSLLERPRITTKAKITFKKVKALSKKETNFLKEILGLKVENKEEYTLELSPVFGICNPEDCLTPLDKRNYKTTVTGDYDIFCYWPLRGPSEKFIPSGNMIREAEKSFQQQNPGINEKAFTLPIETLGNIQKPFNIWIEFIPHYNEIDGLENPDIGNFSKLGSDLNILINGSAKTNFQRKFITEQKNKGNKAPSWTETFKIVKHSDEGGRPGIDEIDLPLWTSNPRGFLREDGSDTAPQRYRVLSNILDFAQYLDAIATESAKNKDNEKGEKTVDQLTFNHAWVNHLLTLALYEPNHTLKPNEAPIRDFKNVDFLPPNDLENGIDDKLHKKLKKLINNINRSFFVAVNEAGKKENPDWETPGIDDQIYYQKRLELFAKVVYVLFGFQPNKNDQLQAFKNRLFPFLNNFTLKLLEYTLDGDMKAMEGLNNVRSTLLSPELNEILNPQPHG